MQELWKLLIGKASPEALLAACSGSTMSALFEVAATLEGKAINWSKVSHVSASKSMSIESEETDTDSTGGSSRAIQMRYDAAEALACIASAWPEGTFAYSLDCNSRYCQRYPLLSFAPHACMKSRD